MGSVGFLLADWSIELIRYRKRKAKGDTKKLKKHQRECSAQTEDILCISCTENSAEISTLSDKIQDYEAKQDQLKKLLSSENADSETGDDITEKVAAVVREASVVREEVERLREERVALGRSVGSQLTQRDTQHSDRVRSLEILMVEKEKQLLQTANLLRQQLAAAKTETHHLQRQLAQSKEQMNSSGSLEQEVDSLRMVLGIKKDETEQLKSANNSLRLEVEKYGGLEVKLQVQVQRTEEMSAVIKMKNEQLRQVLDEYDSVQEQLEVEVSAHLACQQELERSQWARESFLLENEKRWKELNNQSLSGMVLDVVQKEKGLAYSFNC